MPTILETAAKLDNMLKVGWAGTTPIAVDNIPFTETVGQAYLQTQFILYATYNANIGAALNLRKRSEGVLHIVIRTPINEGVGLAYSYAQTISGIMDNQNPLPNLFTYVTDIRRAGDGEDGWFTLLADVPFLSDEA